jgi:hypothetical protein
MVVPVFVPFPAGWFAVIHDEADGAAVGAQGPEILQFPHVVTGPGDQIIPYPSERTRRVGGRTIGVFGHGVPPSGKPTGGRRA